MNGPANAAVETMLFSVLLQLIAIVGAARIFGAVFRRLGQPQVCGEIAAGLVLGPSLFGKIAPGAFGALFPADTGPVLNILSQLGLILLMFLVGLEFDFAHLRSHGKTAAATSLAGVALQFALGVLLALSIHPIVAPDANRFGFALMLATALSITAIPVLSRIMMDLNIHRTPVGSITITAAAVNDVVGWIILTVAVAVVRSEFEMSGALLTIVLSVAFCAAMLLVARPLMKAWIRRIVQREGAELSLTTLAVLVIFILGAAAVTSAIGIFSIFGSFLLGTMLHDERAFAHAVALRFRDFTTVFFLPIFFTYTGLRTDIGSMSGLGLWGIAIAITAVAIVGKLAGCAVAARVIGGLPWREAATIGFLMNTRGLMELIVINVGHELHIFSQSVYFMLVFMTLVTTYMTTPLVRRAIRTTALEPLVAASPFVLGHRRPQAVKD